MVFAVAKYNVYATAHSLNLLHLYPSAFIYVRFLMQHMHVRGQIPDFHQEGPELFSYLMPVYEISLLQISDE